MPADWLDTHTHTHTHTHWKPTATKIYNNFMDDFRKKCDVIEGLWTKAYTVQGDSSLQEKN